MADATATAQVGPTVHRFTDTDTAYDVTQSEERHRMGIRDGDVLVVESEGVVGVLANNWPIALTEAHGKFHLVAERYRIREMNGGRYAASGDSAERVAAELGLSLLPRHRAPVAAPADEDVWEPGHCTTMRGGAVHEVTSGLDGSDGGPVHIFPLCRTGSMTNQGTRYRKVKAELTCKNCIGNRDRRRAAKVSRAAAAAVAEAPAAVEAPQSLPVQQPLTRPVVEGVVVTHDGTAQGSAPKDAAHPDVAAARDALAGLAVATLTDHHDISAPKEEEQAVHGYLIEPRGQGRVAVYWMEAGKVVRRDQAIDGTALDRLAESLERSGWRTERMLRSSTCVFAHRPVDAAAPATVEVAVIEQPAPAAESAPAVHLLGTRKLAVNRCVHHLYATDAVTGDPVSACAQKEPTATVGVFNDEGCVIFFDCAVQAANEAVRLDEEDEAARERAGEGEPFYTWAILCREHEEQPADGCEECHQDPQDEDQGDVESDDEAEASPAKVASDAARHVHRDAHNFQPFHRPGEEAPAAWTFRTGYAAHARYGVTTAGSGVSPVGLYEYVTTAQRAFLQAEKDAQQVAEPAPADPAGELGKHQARQLVAGTWPTAEKFYERRAENGRLLGYTFRVGALHVARYGWITAGGTFAKALEPYRSVATALLPVADRDERAARR